MKRDISKVMFHYGTWNLNPVLNNDLSINETEAEKPFKNYAD